MDAKVRTIVLLLPFFVLGSGMLALGFYWSVLGKQSTVWDRVSGTILATHENSSRIKGQIVSGASISYAYDYRGRTDQSKSLSFGGSPSDQMNHIQYEADGRTISVSVDPEKPNRSVLVPGVMSGAVIFIALGSLIIVTVLAVVTSAFSRKRAS